MTLYSSFPLQNVVLLIILAIATAACDSSDPDPPPGSGNGTLEVSATTTGDTPDPNGYTVTLNGDESREVDPDGSVIFEDVVEGNHELELSGVQVNCTPDGGAMQAVTVTAEETTTTGFDVTCEVALFDQIVFSTSREGADFDLFAMGTDGSNPTSVGGGVGEPGFGPDVSPDGTQILFFSDRTGPTEIFEIFVMSVDGSEIENLTEHSASDEFPSWSPDGERIAFMSNREGNSEVYVMNADGTRVERLTDDPDRDLSPVWSPDGERIAFWSDREGGNHDIYVMDADGSGMTRLTDDPGSDHSPAWSPPRSEQ